MQNQVKETVCGMTQCRATFAPTWEGECCRALPGPKVNAGLAATPYLLKTESRPMVKPLFCLLPDHPEFLARETNGAAPKLRLGRTVTSPLLAHKLNPQFLHWV